MNKMNFNILVAKERAGTLTVDEILRAETLILRSPRFKNKKWIVVSPDNGIKYIYCNGQLLPIMKNDDYIIN